MPEKKSKFHEFALQSILFKGRPDWYFCYLKAERIAHVLGVLRDIGGATHREKLAELAHYAAMLPGDIAHLAAGEVEAPAALADIFSLLSAVRLAATEQLIAKENASVIEREYEHMAERLVAGSHPSPFVSNEDFQVPALAVDDMSPLLAERPRLIFEREMVKDTNKGHSKSQSDRSQKILAFIRQQKSVSIKDIAATIKDCSEKTIQRELGSLIEQGLIRRVGERRWSHYLPI